SDVGDEVRELDTALPMRRELARTGEYGRVGLRERQPQVLRHLGRQRSPVPFFQSGFWIEKIDLARSAFHEEEDDVLRFRRKVRRLRSERIAIRRRAAALALQQLRQGDGSDSPCALAEKTAAALNLRKLCPVHDYSLVMNSSRLSSTRLNSTQLAA